MKIFEISKQTIWEAYQKVKANKGAAGVDEITLIEFEKDLKNNLYKIWNRMTSGSYMPPPVRIVEIPKSDGKTRKLGIPTVGDRIAQTVVKMQLEPLLEKHFHPDSYGYRPNKSAHDAISKARNKCWKYNWVIDLDIKGFFDNLDHGLVMRAVAKHTDCKWVQMYIKRWLQAPSETVDNQLQERTKGTPQGGVISPLLANLFLHYAFDKWITTKYPGISFERYADDILVHCATLQEATCLRKEIEERLKDCKLEINASKTQIVYCKDDNRKENYPITSFEFLGYTFCKRRAINNKGQVFGNFLPAISKRAIKTISQKIRAWKLHLKSGRKLEEIACEINPMVRGWLNYYGRFYKTALNPLFEILNMRLVKWAMRKYKRFRGHTLRTIQWIEAIARKESTMFAHWQYGIREVSGQ